LEVVYGLMLSQTLRGGKELEGGAGGQELQIPGGGYGESSELNTYPLI